MNNIFDTNKFEIRMQLQKLLHQDSKTLTKSHYKLFTLEGKSFVIAVTVVKSSNIWFETYFEKDGIKYDSKRHKIYGCTMTHVIDETLSRLDRNQIENAENILFRQSMKPKPIVKPEIDDSAPRFKRAEPRVPVQKVDEPIDVSHLKEAITEADKSKAKLERKLFKDPKMWIYKS